MCKVYQRVELFHSLRNADRLGGECGRCEYRYFCSGSRARSLAVAGNPWAAEPDCVNDPDVAMEMDIATVHRDGV